MGGSKREAQDSYRTLRKHAKHAQAQQAPCPSRCSGGSILPPLQTSPQTYPATPNALPPRTLRRSLSQPRANAGPPVESESDGGCHGAAYPTIWNESFPECVPESSMRVSGRCGTTGSMRRWSVVRRVTCQCALEEHRVSLTVDNWEWAGFESTGGADWPVAGADTGFTSSTLSPGHGWAVQESSGARLIE